MVIKGNVFNVGSTVTLINTNERNILKVVRNDEVVDKRYYELVLGVNNKKAPSKF